MLKGNIRKRGLLYLLLLVSTAEAGFTQFSITSQAPVGGLFTKNQLWNLLIINNSNRTTTVKVQLTLQDPQSRQTLLSGATAAITIAPGSKMIQYQHVKPVQYNYLGGSIDQNPEGFLPVGTFQACYELVEYLGETYGVLAEECSDIEVEPMSPPLLNSPEDQSVLEYLRPSFSWLPPSPPGMFFNLNYDFILSPVLPGQTLAEAIQYNIPIYSVGSLTQNFLQYPSGTASLDSGKTYAWQVVAKDQSRYASKSEAWSFTCKKDSAVNIVNNAPYIKITNQPSAPSFVYQGIWKAEYYHETIDSTVKVTIARIDKPESILATFNLNVRPGQNFLVYNVSRKIKLNENQCYEARIKIKGRSDHMMRFYPKYFKQ